MKGMRMELFIAIMWVTVLAIAAFLVIFVAAIDLLLPSSPRLAVSVLQATIAIAAVVFLAASLGRLKKAYLKSKLG
jgi:hypothetical protein